MCGLDHALAGDGAVDKGRFAGGVACLAAC